MAATGREREILGLIRQNPMISQRELAQRCGITRSGVAAHISNLVKKGYLQGKGYIVSPPSYVSVIGAVNMDIYGLADNPVVSSSSNVGRITFALGGIGRNISYDLNKLGVRNYLITAYGNDHNGDFFKQDALTNGMDITYSQQFPGTNTSTYLSVSGPDGGQLMGLDDMIVGDLITPSFLADREHAIANSTSVVVDTSLSAQAIAWVCEHATVPVFARVVSVNKAERLIPSLGHIDTVSLSTAETEVLTGIKAVDEASADACAEYLLGRGVKRVFLFLDDVGMLYRTTPDRLYLPAPERRRAHVNGAASGALAALVWARGEGMGFVKSAQVAAALASLSMDGLASINPALTVEGLERRRIELFG
ncbi:PfkB family carbohydrate kinase [Bifidobacterium xylocopae]|uniref:Carbohydrate kinase n=1 Tax=Bifidobacterium xylocopae TaxID=2493119 RepID=A0A366KDL4_9BIFI|nr:PfkB family carbohydrate kinase [Bifidobacterium xylocopae]RBP99835.1 carbohydrate kinase [Bifidobacterium xylocopae]